MNLSNTLTNVKNMLYNILKYVILFSGFITFGILIWYIVCISKGFYHSDCTDTILWAETMLEGKTIMNPDFGYACLLPFGGNLLMLPFVGIWGVSMKAQIAGMVLFAILFTLSMVYMCRTIGLNYKWCSLTVSSVLLVLMSSPKLREIFWEHIIYYSLGIMFLMLGIGFVFAILNSEKISIRHMILLFIWTTLCSMNGSQALAIYCLPVLGAIVIERFLDTDKPLFSKANLKEGLILGIMLVAVLIGLLLAKIVNKDIVAGYQEGYSGFDSMSDWTDNLLSIIPNAFRLFNITTTEYDPIICDYNQYTLYSIEGIFVLVKILFILVVLIVPVIMLIMYRKFEEKSYRLMILAHTVLSLIIIVCWIFGTLNTACWRLSPIFATGTILCIMFIRWIHQKKLAVRFVTVPSLLIVLAMLLITSDVLALSEDNQSVANEQLSEVSQFLKEKDLEYGYGTFWNASIITLMTDSDVKVRVITSTTSGDLYPRLYQSNVNWYKDNSYDEYFIILDNGEYSQYTTSSNYVQPIEYYNVENRHILVYDFNIMELK